MKTDRPKQLMPDEMVRALMAYVRHQFCPDVDDKAWGQMSHFIKRRAVMWPAAFIHGKGFTLPVAKYDEIMRRVFMEIKRHGNLASVRYWPAYVAKCVQEHWRHHWEEYHQEAKSSAAIADAALLGLAKTPIRSGPTVEPIAQAVAVLAAKPRRPAKRVDSQKELF